MLLQMKRFGSEPDLRNPVISNNLEHQDKFRSRKKYKAPQPPLAMVNFYFQTLLHTKTQNI